MGEDRGRERPCVIIIIRILFRSHLVQAFAFQAYVLYFFEGAVLQWWCQMANAIAVIAPVCGTEYTMSGDVRT